MQVRKKITDKKPFRFNSRLKAYSVVLFVLAAVLTTLIAMRTDTDTTILRTPGMLYQTREDGRISNLYAIKTVNKTPNDMPLRLELMNVTGDLELVGKTLELKGGALGRSEAFIILAKDQLTGMKTNVVIGIYSGDELLEEGKHFFRRPNNNRKQMNWGKGLALALIAFAGMMAWFVVMAARNPSPLVTEEIMKKELKFQERIDHTARANALSAPVHMIVTANELRLEFPQEFHGKTISGELTLLRPNDPRAELSGRR